MVIETEVWNYYTWTSKYVLFACLWDPTDIYGKKENDYD